MNNPIHQTCMIMSWLNINKSELSINSWVSSLSSIYCTSSPHSLIFKMGCGETSIVLLIPAEEKRTFLLAVLHIVADTHVDHHRMMESTRETLASPSAILSCRLICFFIKCLISPCNNIYLGILLLTKCTYCKKWTTVSWKGWSSPL